VTSFYLLEFFFFICFNNVLFLSIGIHFSLNYKLLSCVLFLIMIFIVCIILVILDSSIS